ANPRALGCRGEVANARVVARLVEEDLEHRRGIGPQARQDGVEAEHHPRLAFAAHLPGSAGTRSILRWSTSTRTRRTLMRSVRRKRRCVRSPKSRWRAPSYWKYSRPGSEMCTRPSTK